MVTELQRITIRYRKKPEGRVLNMVQCIGTANTYCKLLFLRFQLSLFTNILDSEWWSFKI